jgi:aspartyl-tRNA synthetase
MKLKTSYRTHTCGELSKTNVNQKTTLSGFINTIRDHGDLIFFDLRDRFGITQIVIPKVNKNFSMAQNLKPETVVMVTGKIKERSENAKNSKIPTGEIEIEPEILEILSKVELDLPFQVTNNEDVNEQLRLKYRYLDLRRSRLKELMDLRHEMVLFARKFFDERKFLEFQTPIMTGSTPEGARDYVIPSRVYPGNFYALPQSPQQYKQLLMIAGYDRYFQFAPCFRDEDPRADRLYGDFYQIDAEMAFVRKEDIYKIVTDFFKEVVNKFTNKTIPDYRQPYNAFPALSYSDAMKTFGSDKPDLRTPLQIVDITEVAHKTEADFLKNSRHVRAVLVTRKESKDSLSRQKISELENYLKDLGAGGLGYLKVEEDSSFSGSLAKFFNPEEIKDELNKKQEVLTYAPDTKGCSSTRRNEEDLLNDKHPSGWTMPGDTIFIVAENNYEDSCKYLDKLIRKLGEDLDLIDHTQISFCWIHNFPFFEINSEGKLDIGHNPFSKPDCTAEEFKRLKTEDPLKIYAQQYDLACNGYEILSGGERNYDPEILSQVFEILGYKEEDINARFGHMLTAFKYGAPPTAGFAIGFDRFFMTMIGETNIRNVFAFPKDAKGFDPLFNCPNELSPEQLKELEIKVI